MNNIPSFKANLIQSSNVNKPAPKSVEEILGQTEPAVSYQPHKSSGTMLKVVTAATALAGLGILGQRGTFGKSVQKILGGIPKLSTEQIQETISSKLAEYVSRTEDAPFALKILKNGKTTATRMLANGNKEVISFSAQTGEPEFRVLFGNVKNKNALNYTTYKGPDILDEGFDTANSFYKKFVRGGNKRKYIIGPKQNNTEIIYGNMVRADGQIKYQNLTTYYRNGDINNIQYNDIASGSSSMRKMLYGEDKKLKGFDLIDEKGTVIRKVKGKAPVVLSEQNVSN